MQRLVCSLAVATALLVGLAVAAAPASAAKPPAGLFGAGDWGFPTDSDLANLERDGVRSWRTTLDWGAIERAPGRFEFSGYDQLLQSAANRRVRMLITIAGCPAWACERPGPPRTAEAAAAFQRFVGAAVRRYGHAGLIGRGGRTWPVTHWQVLNEVNGADQWPNPDPVGYAALLKATNATIKAADPSARTVLAGLPEKMTIWLRAYLPALYRQPGFASDFDVLAVQGYAVKARGASDILELTRRIMRRRGDRKPVWITEMGWSTGGLSFPFTVSERRQATLLRQSFSRLASCARRWRLQRVFWFSYRDRDPRGEPDYWGFHNGLRRLTGVPKPAHRTFVRFVQRKQRVPRRCGFRGV